MMKVAMFGKMLGIMIGAMLALSASALAMTFSQPVKIGEIILDTQGIFNVEGYTYHTGKRFTNKEFQRLYTEKNLSLGSIIYDKGLATFGQGNDEIYFHYDSRNGKPKYDSKSGYDIVSQLGAKDINNTVSVDIAIPTYLKVIRTDRDITLYLLEGRDPSGLTGPTHIVVGRLSNGVYVKYFDTRKIKKQYFKDHREYHLAENILIDKDTIIIPYEGFLKNTKGVKGAFRFKWDEAAQWFGVEQVMY